jgi:hypothetical protein
MSRIDSFKALVNSAKTQGPTTSNGYEQIDNIERGLIVQAYTSLTQDERIEAMLAVNAVSSGLEGLSALKSELVKVPVEPEEPGHGGRCRPVFRGTNERGERVKILQCIDRGDSNWED